MASTAQQIGGATGPAVLVGVANAGPDFDTLPGPTAEETVDGLRNAGLPARLPPVIAGTGRAGAEDAGTWCG
ncbi:hypothetical protein [Streptomyces sp. NBC_01803]|uniref:hypothetical protein n=1 Tax=Streptomyces sp. NBC_01803 TaxID=2975946 RepID=UPI002DD87A1D|nr:hypothetical protein [Streptomyces sp. NBC_01803]WSA42974.1 hypothetical protein OIE51_01415 [Streptomyces sp. NBC_01803]